MHIFIANGQFYTRVPGGTTMTEVPLPTGVTAVANVRPCFARYSRLTYIVGRFTPGLCYRSDVAQLFKPGLTRPTAAVTIAAGAGAVTSTGTTYRITWAHWSGTTLIHESNPSPESNEIVVSNGGFSIANIPATAPDERTTHANLYRSDNGGQYGFDQKVALGVTTATSSLATLSLGNPLPYTTAGALDEYARGVPPYTKFVETYHDRMWFAGDPNYPRRVWYSRLAEPESLDPRDKTGNYIDTRDGEAVTGLKRVGDLLAVFTSSATYVIQGYSDGADGTGPGDFTMVKVSPSIGCIANSAIVNVGGPRGGDLIYFPAQDGIWAYNGSSFSYQLEDLRSYWRDAYIADKANYENSTAIFDRFHGTYKLLIPAADSSFYYIGKPSPAGGQPDWCFDVRGRRDYSLGLLAAANSSFFETYTGSCDGYARKENQELVGDDDGIDKICKWRPRHYYFAGIAGGQNHGQTFVDVDFYGKHETTGMTLYLNAGDDFAGGAVTAQCERTIQAAAVATFAAETAIFSPLEKVSGRGISIQAEGTNSIGWEINGFGVSFRQGPNTRNKVT